MGRLALLTSAVLASVAQAAPLALTDVPLFVTTGVKANVLLIMDNSNSMDEAASGSAVGSASPDSKSEIARGVAKNLVGTYTDKINMGLMAYQQHLTGGDAVTAFQLHNSPYDISYDPTNYDSTFTGARDSLTKRFRIANTTSPGDFVHFNVALPFYAGSNQGNAFCYSLTADFDNGSETYPAGPWDNYRCYNDKNGTSDVLPPTPGAAAASGYSGNFYNGVLSPTDSDLAQGILDFGRFLSWYWVSPTWFSNASPGRGFLHVPIADLDATHASKVDTKLGTSQFTDNKPDDPAYPLQNAGLTPLEGTLLTAKDYFAGNLTSTDQGGPQPAPPESCGKDYTVLLTDGLPSTSQSGAVVSDPAVAITDTAAAAAALKSDDVETYVVGFALPYGTDPTTLDKVAVSGGTSSSYLASDATSLGKSLDLIFADILAKVGASSSLAATSGSVTTTSLLYQARFNSGTWSGQLRALDIDSDGVTVDPTPIWDAAVELNDKTYSDRVIITATIDPADLTKSKLVGEPFEWSNLHADDQAALNDDPTTGAVDNDGNGSARLDYLRGDSSNEGSSGLKFRERSCYTDDVVPVLTPCNNNKGRLGDIVNSAPIYVGAPALRYTEASYQTFKTANNSRKPMVYVGSNDGMLHGFDATSGEELLAYVPHEMYPNLSKLTDPAYVHRYFVDGNPTAIDAYVGSKWMTVLAGALNKGGKSIYALDVTDPSGFTTSNADDIFLWEFKDANLGYTYGTPTIARMHNGKWAVIFGNGYNNTGDGKARLYILFIEDGTDGTWSGSDFVTITTGVGDTTTPNGLSTPAVVDLDGDNYADYIYAGDVRGNMWRFDVSASTTGSWSKSKLFAAGSTKPITTRPIVGTHPNRLGGVMVYFGTGKFLETGDNSTSGASTQTFYGIWDQFSGATVLSSKLLAQTVLNGSDLTATERFVSDNAITWDLTGSTVGAHLGWYLDLPVTGEKQVTNSVLRQNRIIFTTLIPPSGGSPCSSNLDGWIMALDTANGGRLDDSFDTNGDGKIDAADQINFSGVTQAVGGLKTNGGSAAGPVVLSSPPGDGSNPADRNECREAAETSVSGGGVEGALLACKGDRARQIWQQLR
jgi:type IV pilus assembly protein PilY1